MIAMLIRFEDIRYPDEIMKRGAQIAIGWERPALKTGFPSKRRKEPIYELFVNDVDRAVIKIFSVLSRNPQVFMGISLFAPHARGIIEHQNPVAAQLLPGF